MTEKKLSASERLLAKTKRTSDVAANYTTTANTATSKLPVTMPGQLGAFRLEAQKYTDRIKELEAQVMRQDIPLESLKVVEGRERNLTAEEYGDLRENLRRNPLVTPITVRETEAGQFEIVSGHNRVKVYRELGRTSISAVVQTTDKTQANINAFYANLLQTDLSDYEKYVGFKMIQGELHLTQAEIAQHSGRSESFISRLMAFAELPLGAIALIEDNPSIIGMDAAHQLAKTAREAKRPGDMERVLIAVEKLHAGEIDQMQAVRFAKSAHEHKPPVLTKPIKIRSGKSEYCAVRRVNRSLRIDFKSADEAEAVEKAVLEILEQRVRQLKAVP